MRNIKNPILLKILISFQLIMMTFLSLKSQHDIIQVSLNDKLLHFMAYSTLTLWLYLLFSSKTILIKSLFLLFLYGLFIEFLQYFIPNRYFSVMDILANFLGIFVTTMVVKKIKLLD